MKNIVFTVFAKGMDNLSDVRLILDAVAHRIARDAWQGAFSDEALERVHGALKRLVRRKVCIVARQVAGFSHKHLDVLWTVGTARILGAQGDWIVRARAQPSSRSSQSSEMRLAGRIAHAAGAYHDLGKNTAGFQAKLLRSEPVADAFRHELLTLAQLRGVAWGAQLANWKLAMPCVGASRPVGAGASQSLDWVEHLILTHHRLPGANDHELDLAADRHVNASQQSDPTALAQVDTVLAGVARHDGLKNPIPGRLGFALSRLSLMLADHYVSSVHQDAPGATRQHRPSALRHQILKHLQAPSTANANPDNAREQTLGQSLAGHLKAVGAMARVIAPSLANSMWAAGVAALEPGRFEKVAGTRGRFAWQSQAVTMAKRYARSLPPGLGGLILVGSATGSGKTRACLAMADALGCAVNSSSGLRVTVALGLRTLTLQTGHEYRDVFGLSPDEMGVLIGSRAVLQFDEHARTTKYAQEPVRELGRDEGVDADLDADAQDLDMTEETASEAAQFLPFIEAQCKKNGQKRYLDAPVLVTTLDQVIKAADHRRAGWILPWLRIASSSALILDEVDGYDLSDFPPLLRLVEFAAMLGTPVIASSATIYPAFASALAAAWQDGARERARFLGVDFPRPSCLLVGDETNASRVVAVAEIDSEFAAYCREMTKCLAPRRVGRVIGASAMSRQSMFREMAETSIALHADNQVATTYGTGLSVGLVRIAHVKNAIAFARFLEQSEPESGGPVIKAVLYHSQNTVLARALIEQRLDKMLYRKSSGEPNPLAPLEDAQVAAAVRDAAAQCRDVCVMVIATSVEEVGRDHDFDWAVIEPSSARSIVQACGRVLRHRANLPTSFNVAVLARNFREIDRIERGFKLNACFTRPGFEFDGQPFPDHELGRALEQKMGAERKVPHGFLIDARMCLLPDAGELGALENGSIQYRLDHSFRNAWSAKPAASMVRNHYAEYRLRQNDQELSAVLDLSAGQFFVDDRQTGRQERPLHTTHVLESRALWRLCWSDLENSFDGLDVHREDFRQMRIPHSHEPPAELIVDPLYGLAAVDP
jgi:CRISPR-associated endonuclease/helicase Cas3